MNQGLVDRFNSIVGKDDLTYFLGDMSLSFKPIPIYVPQLNGRKRLVLGNHDVAFKMKKPQCVQKYIDSGFESVSMGEEIEIDGKTIVLSHFPYRPPEPTTYDVRFLEYRPKDTGKILIHGHNHSAHLIGPYSKMINVGVDVWDYYPVSEEELISLIRNFYG